MVFIRAPTPIPYPRRTHWNNADKEIMADHIALLLFAMKHFKGRLFRPVDKVPSRDFAISAYVDMFNMFGGAYALISPGWCVRFEYYPDISLKEDAYRMGFFLAQVSKEKNRRRKVVYTPGPPICLVNTMKMTDRGFELFTDDMIFTSRVEYERIQAAVRRRAQTVKADPSRDYRPLPQSE